MLVNKTNKNEHICDGTKTVPGVNLIPDGLGLQDNADFKSQEKAGFFQILVPPRPLTSEEVVLKIALKKAQADAVAFKIQLDRFSALRPPVKEETHEWLLLQDAASEVEKKLKAEQAKHADTRTLPQIVCELPEAEAVKIVGMCSTEQLKEIDILELESRKRKAIFAAIRARLDDLTPVTFGGLTLGMR